MMHSHTYICYVRSYVFLILICRDYTYYDDANYTKTVSSDDIFLSYMCNQTICAKLQLITARGVCVDHISNSMVRTRELAIFDYLYI